MSTQDKRAANQNLLAMINALLAVAPQMSEEAIEMQVEAIEFEASLSDMDHIYSKPKLNKMFLSQQQPLEIPEQGQQPQAPVNRDVAAELAPQTFLADANL